MSSAIEARVDQAARLASSVQRLARSAAAAVDLARRLAAELAAARSWHAPVEWTPATGRVLWLYVHGTVAELFVGSPDDPEAPTWLTASRADGPGAVKWFFLGRGPTRAERDLEAFLAELESP